MLGSIGTKQRCKECKGIFSDRDKHGFKCPQCGTRPTTYIVRAKAFGIKNPLYRTPEGELLSHISLAEGLLASIRSKWTDCKDKSRFKTDDFIAQKIVLQKFEMKAKEFLSTKDNLWFREKPKISKSEWYGLHNRFKNFIIPFFEGKDIRDLDRQDIQKFYDHLLGMRLDNGTSYSDKHIYDICVNLRALLTYNDLPVPKFPEGWNDVEPKKTKKPMSIEMQMKISPFIPETHGYKLALNIFNYAPMRPCELRALLVSDITETGVMVWKSLTDRLKQRRKKNGKPQHFALPIYIMDDLKKHVEGKGQDDFIFTIRGNPYTDNSLRKMWNRTLIKAGVEHIEFYQAIRHSWASREWSEGQSEILDRIQKKLGHHNKTTAKKHYII